MWVSAVIFGLTAWSIPGIMASFCGDILGPQNATTILGLITLFFSLGSIMGPASGGYIKEVSTSFAGAFYLAAFFALTGALLSFSMWKKTISPAISNPEKAADNSRTLLSPVDLLE